MKKIRFQKLVEGAVLPRYGSDAAAGLDIFLPDGSRVSFVSGETLVIPLGIKVEIPQGYVGKMKARSSYFSKGWRVDGYVDADYRGELKLMIQAPCFAAMDADYCLDSNKAVAQLLVEQIERFAPEWAEDLSNTTRGEGGFGSTNR